MSLLSTFCPKIGAKMVLMILICCNVVIYTTGYGLYKTRWETQSHTADDAVKLGGKRQETRWQTR